MSLDLWSPNSEKTSKASPLCNIQVMYRNVVLLSTTKNHRGQWKASLQSAFPLGDAECEEHGNCCPDFQQHCRKEMEQIKDTNFGSGTSCAIIGCGKFLSGKPCTLATLRLCERC